MPAFNVLTGYQILSEISTKSSKLHFSDLSYFLWQNFLQKSKFGTHYARAVSHFSIAVMALTSLESLW